MKKLCKLLCVGVLATAMAFTMAPTAIYAAEEAGWEEGPNENEPEAVKEKAKLENLTLYAYDMLAYNGKPVDFNDFTLAGSYYLNYRDFVENKDIYAGGGTFFHTTMENLTPDVVEMSLGGELGGKPELIIESKDRGMMAHTGVGLKGIKEGTAKIKCTIYDLENPELTKTEIVTITFKKGEPAPLPNDDITYISMSDILSKEEVKMETIERIKTSNKATIHLGMKNYLDTISLPKEIMQTAKDLNIPLTVSVEMDGKTTTWTFDNMDTVMDINLSMSVVKASDIETLKDKDGLVLAFNHNGVLPTGTTVKTYVGDTYKAGDKVQLSYFNDKTNTLEETKEYIVDVDGYVTVVINHCSNYLLEAVKENVVPTPEPNPTPAPNPTPTPAPTPVPGTVTPSDTEKKTTDTADTKKETPAANEKGKGSVATGDTTNTMVLLGMMVLSAIGLLVFKKKAKNI